MSKRQIALITGWSLLLMALVAGFTIGYAFEELNPPGKFDSLREIILENQGLYQLMLFGFLVIVILDFLVSYTLYSYFKDDNRNISLISGLLRVIYTLIFGIAIYFLTKNLYVNDITNQSIDTNYQLFKSIWNGGLVIFGFHIFLIGILMKLHRSIPKILWYLTLIAGVSYIIVPLLELIYPNSEFVTTLGMVLALPMAVGELGLAIWLLIKGGKEKLV